MRKITRILLTLTLAGALLCGGAMAAGEESVTVQLDGQTLTFTDAHPQMRNDRTFLPFRALFEAMGAEVSYEDATETVTAVRGERTITMVIGSKELTITEGANSTTMEMDVAPYVDDATWRTYVPVRFAAQALNCAVGWEDESGTVIIVDTEKLVAGALEGKSFTYLEKLMSLFKAYDEGIWDMKANVSADLSVLTMPLFTMEGTAAGTTQDGAKESLDMNLKMDMTALMALAGGKVTEEDQVILRALATEGMDVSMRMDTKAGTVYMNMDSKGFMAELDPNGWYKMDLASLAEAEGLSWAEALTANQGLDLAGMLTQEFGSLELTNAATDYSTVKKMVEELCAVFADDNFQQDENGVYNATCSLDTEDKAVELVLSLAMEGDVVRGGQLTVTLSEDDRDVVAALYMDGAGKMQMGMAMVTGGGKVTANMAMEASYTQGTTAPETQPPAGATILEVNDLDELMGAMSIPGGI